MAAEPVMALIGVVLLYFHPYVRDNIVNIHMCSRWIKKKTKGTGGMYLIFWF